MMRKLTQTRKLNKNESRAVHAAEMESLGQEAWEILQEVPESDCVNQSALINAAWDWQLGKTRTAAEAAVLYIALRFSMQ